MERNRKAGQNPPRVVAPIEGEEEEEEGEEEEEEEEEEDEEEEEEEDDGIPQVRILCFVFHKS